MKILLITDGVFPWVVGGMQRHSAHLARELTKAGHDLTLVHCVAQGAKVPDKDEVAKELGVTGLSNFNSICLQFPKTSNFPGHYLKDSYQYSRIVYQKLASELTSFDFIYAKGFSAWHFIERKKKGEKSIPPIGVKFHGYEMFQKPANFKARLQHWLLAPPVRWNTLNADVVFSYGGKISQLIESLGVARSKIIEIPTGIGEDWIRENLQPTTKPIKFLFIGRFERRKGVEELNEALRRFSSAQPLQFSFIGPIPPSAKLPGLHYHGQITEAREMQSIIDECHVLVLPSHSEGMPNVIVEAMSRGLAIAATDVGAIDVQIDTQCGWLMKPGSFQSILQTMEEITNSSEEEIHHKRVAARDRVKSRFLWPGIAQRTGSEIEQFIRRIG